MHIPGLGVSTLVTSDYNRREMDNTPWWWLYTSCSHKLEQYTVPHTHLEQDNNKLSVNTLWRLILPLLYQSKIIQIKHSADPWVTSDYNSRVIDHTPWWWLNTVSILGEDKGHMVKYSLFPEGTPKEEKNFFFLAVLAWFGLNELLQKCGKYLPMFVADQIQGNSRLIEEGKGLTQEIHGFWQVYWSASQSASGLNLPSYQK